jgi:hypothetical protein
MTALDDQGIDLTTAEADHLATRLCGTLLANAVNDGLIDWEIVPNLNEQSWELVATRVGWIGEHFAATADRADKLHGVDSRELLERAQ